MSDLDTDEPPEVTPRAARTQQPPVRRSRSRPRDNGWRGTRARSPWYATEVDFQSFLNQDLDQTPEHAQALTAGLTEPAALIRNQYRVLTYRHAGLDVPGRRDPVPVVVEFYEDPTYEAYGLHPRDYPRVFADIGKASPHRLTDDALCLYYPLDPPERRWLHTNGLVVLLEIVRQHLLFEEHWRQTGGFGDHRGRNRGTWLGEEAPHGFDESEAA